MGLFSDPICRPSVTTNLPENASLAMVIMKTYASFFSAISTAIGLFTNLRLTRDDDKNLTAFNKKSLSFCNERLLVGAEGFEPPTLCL